MLNDLTERVGLGALLMVSAVGACSLLYRSHLRRAALRSMSAPSQWPITARELVGPDEHDVWQWLCAVFADYHVMLKIPLVRYTAPTTPAESKVWHKRLSGVYCTFTVCGADGTVIGCVDVVGERQGSSLVRSQSAWSVPFRWGAPSIPERRPRCFIW